MIREATYSDTGMIAEIYNYYILNSIITFELDPISPEEIMNRMESYKEVGPYLVYEENGEIIGYTYVSRFRETKAYEHSVESTIYLKNGFGGKGPGSRLYSELFAQVPLRGIVSFQTTQVSSSRRNAGSEKLGIFRKVVKNLENGWMSVFGKREKMFDLPPIQLHLSVEFTPTNGHSSLEHQQHNAPGHRANVPHPFHSAGGVQEKQIPHCQMEER